MKAAAAALVAAALFFTGVLLGSQGASVGAPIPRPVVVVATESTQPGPSGRTEARNAPAPDELDVETVEHPVEEGSVEDYGGDDHEKEDSSGPGSDDDAPEADDAPETEEPEPEPEDSQTDNSGPGSADSESGTDNSGPGSSSSESGSSGSGSGGSG